MVEALRIGFIGTGRVGTALAYRFYKAGLRISSAYNRSPEGLKRFLGYVPDAKPCSDPQEVLGLSDLVFVTTSDDALEGVVRGLAWEGRHMAVHTSGAHSVEVLSVARERGASVGSFHPCQAFATVEQAIENIPGSVVAIEASDERLKKVLEDLAGSIGCTTAFIPSEGKVLYHAACVFASNYLVALVGIATGLLESIGVDLKTGTELLLPLIKGTVTNIQNIGLPKCLTGPIARGDIGVIRKHLEALKEVDPETFELYARLGLKTVPIGLGKGTLSPERAEELRALFRTVLGLDGEGAGC